MVDVVGRRWEVTQKRSVQLLVEVEVVTEVQVDLWGAVHALFGLIPQVKSALCNITVILFTIQKCQSITKHQCADLHVC